MCIAERTTEYCRPAPGTARVSSLWLLALGFALALLSWPIPGSAAQYSTTAHGNQATGVQLVTSVPRGSCAQCHSAHGSGSQFFDYGLFAGNYGAGKNQLCFTVGCHPDAGSKGTYLGQSIYAASIHNTDMNSYWPGATPPARSSSDAGNCVNCHDPHGSSDASGAIATMTIAREEGLCLACHDSNGPAMKNIDNLLRKSRTHPVSDTSMAGRHQAGEQVIASNFSGAKRHIECADCHNAHKLPSGTTHTAGTNVASDVLQGVSRVEAQYGIAAWQPPAFTPRAANYASEIRYEYELCFKCHSSWAYGSAPPAAPSGGIETDQSVEFNPNNLSYHPVVGEVKNNSYTSPTITNGNIETMESPWNNGRHDTMYCSDCHRSEVDSDPKGPHGSSNAYVLCAPTSSTNDSFCLKCHKQSVYAPSTDPGSAETGSRFDAHTTNSPSASHYYHMISQGAHCRDCHAGAESAGGTITSGSAHGTNRAVGFITGVKIQSYSPGRCWPTCHGEKTYTDGSE